MQKYNYFFIQKKNRNKLRFFICVQTVTICTSNNPFDEHKSYLSTQINNSFYFHLRSYLGGLWFRLRKRTYSEPTANLLWRQLVKTNPSTASRLFPNAKIMRNNDIANYFEQKMSFLPFSYKRGSLSSQAILGKNALLGQKWVGNNVKMRYATPSQLTILPLSRNPFYLSIIQPISIQRYYIACNIYLH